MKTRRFMGISRDDLVLFLSEHHGDGSPGVHVRIETDDVAELHAELQKKKYRYMNPGIVEQEWGTREMTVVDLVGDQLIFSEPIE